MSLIESSSSSNVTHSLTVAAEQAPKPVEVAPERFSSLEHPSYMLTGHDGAVNAFTWSHNGNMFATGGKDGRVLLWDTFPSPVNMEYIDAHSNQILDLAYSHDDLFLLSGGADTRGYLWDVETRECVQEMLHRGDVAAVASNGRGPHVFATATDEGTCWMWDMRQKAPTSRLDTRYPLTSVCVSRDGDLVYTAGVDELIRCWDLRQGQVLYTLRGHSDTITGLTLSSDGSMLVSNATDNSVRTWDVRACVPAERVATGRAIGLYAGHVHDRSQQLMRVSLASDGGLVCAGSADGSVCVWDVESYRLVYKLGGHRGAVGAVALHPSQPIIGSASVAGTMSVCEVARV